VVLDSVGGETWRRSLALLAPFGRLVSFGNAGGEEPWAAGFASLIANAAGAHAFSISTLARTAPQALRPLAERSFALVAEDKVEMPITAEFDLQDAAEAHVLLESRASTGKIVLRVSSPQ
jgi:NADPH2:quinone reductase